MSIWTYERTVSRDYARKSGSGWTRRAVFHGVPASTAESLVPEEFSPWPGTAGKFAECLVGSRIDRDWRPCLSDSAKHLAQVTLYYRPLTWMEWLENHPNKAVLIGSSSVATRRIRSVPATAAGTTQTLSVGTFNWIMPTYGNGIDFTWSNLFGGVGSGTGLITVEGQDHSDTTGRKRWQVIQGSPVQFLGRTVYEVFSVINNPDVFYYQFAPKVGCWNNLEMMRFPLAPTPSRIGQWLLVGLSFAPRPGNKMLWNWRARFALSMDPQGWAEPTVSRQLEVQTSVVDQKDELDNVIGKRTVRVLVPTGKQNTVHLTQPANFSPIDAMLINSWRDSA